MMGEEWEGERKRKDGVVGQGTGEPMAIHLERDIGLWQRGGIMLAPIMPRLKWNVAPK